jgi:anti-sigma regulatory factor (Ser/Thr protein kinase)
MSQKLEFNIVGGDFNLAGLASSKIKKRLKALGIDSLVIKRVVVATYEAELNVVAHAQSGKLVVSIEQDYIQVVVTDSGPGITNIDQAMEAGFSTASKEVRDMGFGAGMGLPNIKKNTDELKLESKVGAGTTLSFKIRL